MHLEWSNRMQQTRLVLNWLERSFAEKYLEVLVLHMDHKCSLAAKVNIIPGQIRKCLPTM